MRITSNNSAPLSSQWRALRLSSALIVISLSLLFAVGSVISGLRPSCCAVARDMSCSSCGMTRSVCAIFHGDLHRANAFHPGGIWLVALVAACLVLRPLPYLFPSTKIILFDSIAFVLAWLLLASVFFGLPGTGYFKEPRAESGLRK